MPSQVIYDDVAYHNGAPVFLTEDLDPHSAGTHIGMYLAWIIRNRLESFSLRQTAAIPVEEVRAHNLTGREFLFAHCAGRLDGSALNPEAQTLTESYYEQYLRDYQDALLPKGAGAYSVSDTPANYSRLAAVLDKRLHDFRGRKKT
jgi:hypothetical protein